MRSTIKLLIVALAMIALGFMGCAGKSDLSDMSAAGGTRATQTQVSSFGTNPGSLAMYKYVPTSPKSPAALVVALHGCTQSAADYATQSGWNTLADKYGFYVVYAEQNSSNNSSKCFNWFESGDIARGGGEALSIKQMVDYMKSNYTIDDSKVYVTGLSAGGYFTAVMMAAYPDVFAGGAVMAGGPYKCATSMTAAFSCMSPGVDKTPSAWATLVTSAYSSFSGTYPSLMVFQGASDSTVAKLNMTELVDQWTGVYGIDQTADSTTTISGHEVKEYQDASGKTLVKTFLITGMGHAITVDPGTGETQGGATGSYAVDKNLYSSYYAADFWGLTKSDQVNPTVSITSPSNGATVSGTVTVAASASDNEAVAKVEFYVGGILKNTVTAAPYSFSWNTASEYNGNYTLSAKAYDTTGNTAESSIAITITGGLTDTTAPTVTADKDSGTYTTSVTVALSANEPATIYYTTDGSTPTASSAVYSSALTFTADTTLKFIGVDGSGNTSSVVTKAYTIDVLAYSETASGTCTEHYVAGRLDVSGYTSCGTTYGYSTSVTLYKLKSDGSWVFESDLPSSGGSTSDTTAPTVSLTAPANGATVSGTVTLTASASDNVGVSKVEFYVNGTLKSTDTASAYQYALDTTTLSNGSVTLLAKAYDAAGNTADSSVTVTVSNQSSDTTAPTVSLTAPANGATVSGTVTLTASASDNVGVSKVEFYVNGTLKSTDTASAYEYALDTTTLSNGSVTLLAKAYDAAGNTADSSVTVTVSNQAAPAATVGISTPASGATISKGTTFSVTGTSANAVQVTVKLVGATSGYVYKTTTLTSNLANWSTSFTTTIFYTSGGYKIQAIATDSSGNTVTTEIPITLQ